MDKTIEQIKVEIENGTLVELKLIDNKHVGCDVMPYNGLYGEGVSLDIGKGLRQIYVYADQSERISAMSDKELAQWCKQLRESQNLAWDKPLISGLIKQTTDELKKRFGDDWRKVSRRL